MKFEGLNFIFVFFPVLRDIEERGRDLEHILLQYTTLVKPAFEEFCLPVSTHPGLMLSVFCNMSLSSNCGSFLKVCLSLIILSLCFLQTKKFADVIIPRGAENTGNRLIAK